MAIYIIFFRSSPFVFRLMLGLMLPTWFLSMWISNTAATSMMIPIIQAVMIQIREAEKIKNIQNGDVFPNNGLLFCFVSVLLLKSTITTTKDPHNFNSINILDDIFTNCFPVM